MTEKNKQDKQPNYKLRRAVVAAGLLLTAGLVAKQLSESAEAPAHNKAEVEIMHEARLKPEKLTLDFKNEADVLKEGVKVRTTPNIPVDPESGKPSDKNVWLQVGSGEVVVFDNPVVYVDDNGDEWFGAVLGHNDEPKGPEQIAGTMVWFNKTHLSKQTNSKGESFYDTYGTERGQSPIAREEGLIVEIGDEGQIKYGEHTIATVHRIAESEVADFIGSTAA